MGTEAIETYRATDGTVVELREAGGRYYYRKSGWEHWIRIGKDKARARALMAHMLHQSESEAGWVKQ